MARSVIWAAAILASMVAVPAAGQDSPEERVRRILSEVPLIDGHNDLPGKIRDAKTSQGDVGTYDLRQRTEGDTDLPRLRAGMVGAQFWSVHVSVDHPRPAMQQLEQLDIARRILKAYPDQLEFAGTASDIERVYGAGRIASLFGIEGGHVIENSLGALRTFYDAGARYMGLTHFANTDWADSATDSAVVGGLSPFGEEVVREMNRMGMLVDLSHVSPAAMSDALNVAEAPVIFSHAGAKALADHPRNVPDSILVRLRENGGVLMQLFYPPYLTVDEGATTSIATVADHIEHIRDVAGIDHVGIGSDFDGIPAYVPGLEDVSTYPDLFVELVRRGWSDDDLRKLAGENLLRVMREAEAVSRRLKRERPPSTKTFQELDGRRSGDGVMGDARSTGDGPGGGQASGGAGGGSGSDEVWSRVEHRYAESEGVRIHYAILGAEHGPEAPLVVMIHGFPDFWYTWRDQMAALADTGYRVAAVDTRGYNLSDQPEGVESYAMPLLVQDVAAVIAAEGEERAVVVGHDWGGMIAWSTAMARPDVVDRLIVLNLPHPRGLTRELANNPAQQAASEYARNFQREGSHRALTPEGLAGWVTDLQARERYVEAFRRSSLEGMMAYYKANYPRPPYQEMAGPVPPVRADVLQIHGMADRYLLAGALEGTGAWVDGEYTLVELPGVGHFVQQEASEEVTRVMLEWLER
ncbi:MAG: alpha/beta fold hydrolase [Longimicrobiales bacterium]|nr:alpha/beta fold hydrolase [Longimicrobiales bacterium]